MNIITGMARITGGRRAFEDTIDMAATASSADMGTDQLEGGCVVIECGRFPSAGSMASLAELTHRTPVSIIADVAGITIGRRALEDTIGMTASTGSANMRAGQLESRSIVIKSSRLPGCGAMAGLADLAQSTLVRILAGMASVTVGGRALVDTINMTAGTGGADMRTRQFEGSGIVIE